MRRFRNSLVGGDEDTVPNLPQPSMSSLPHINGSEDDEKSDGYALAYEPSALENDIQRRPPRSNGGYINAFNRIRLGKFLPRSSDALDDGLQTRRTSLFNRRQQIDPSDPSGTSSDELDHVRPVNAETDAAAATVVESDDMADANEASPVVDDSVIVDTAVDSPVNAVEEVSSTTAGLFESELVHDLRPVLVQARAGVDLSTRVAIFAQEVIALQKAFANKLEQIIETERIRLSVMQQTDSMDGIRGMWVQAIDDSQAWADTSRDMATSLTKLVEPLKRQVKSSADAVDQIVAENDRLSKPLPDLQNAIAKRQIKCSKLLSPMLNPDFRAAPDKKQSRHVAKARPMVLKYLDDLYSANEWLHKIQTQTRPRMLGVMQRLEEQRMESTRRVLMRYSTLMKTSSKILYKTSVGIEERLASYHVEDDVNAFVEKIVSRPRVESECFSPFVYRLPVTMYELGIQHKLENQIRRFRGLEVDDGIDEIPHETSEADAQGFFPSPDTYAPAI